MMAKDQDDYDTLDLLGDETDAQVKKKYKQLCAVHHPDKGGDQDTFIRMKKAYERIINGDEGIENIQAEALTSLHACFSSLMEQVNLDITDLVAVARKTIQYNIDEKQSDLTKAKQNYKKYKRFEGRMKSKSEINLYDIIIADKIKLAENNEAMAVHALQVMTIMIDMLKDYKFEYTEQSFAGGQVRFTNTSTNWVSP